MRTAADNAHAASGVLQAGCLPLLPCAALRWTLPANMCACACPRRVDDKGAKRIVAPPSRLARLRLIAVPASGTGGSHPPAVARLARVSRRFWPIHRCLGPVPSPSRFAASRAAGRQLAVAVSREEFGAKILVFERVGRVRARAPQSLAELRVRRPLLELAHTESLGVRAMVDTAPATHGVSHAASLPLLLRR